MQDEITPAQRVEIDDFLADSRTLRFVESDDNWTALANFLDEHSLPTDHQSMVYAYETLVKQEMLELLPFREPIVTEPQPQPAPSPEQPAPAPVPQRRETFAMRNGKEIDIGQGARRF